MWLEWAPEWARIWEIITNLKIHGRKPPCPFRQPENTLPSSGDNIKRHLGGRNHAEEEALRFKNGYEVVLALNRIEDRLPFKLIALYMDNGCEFINEDMIKRFSLKKIKLERETVIKLFRSRPYKKNDQCHVEQKNFTHVRELFGYDRYEGRLMVQLMNGIYRNEWRLLSNFFHPQIRLTEKYRLGAKLIRRFATPKTPFEQLLPHLSEEKRSEMISLYESLNPFELRKKLKRKLRDLQSYNNQSIDRLGNEAL